MAKWKLEMHNYLNLSRSKNSLTNPREDILARKKTERKSRCVYTWTDGHQVESINRGRTALDQNKNFSLKTESYIKILFFTIEKTKYDN